MRRNIKYQLVCLPLTVGFQNNDLHHDTYYITRGYCTSSVANGYDPLLSTLVRLSQKWRGTDLEPLASEDGLTIGVIQKIHTKTKQYLIYISSYYYKI